MAFKVTFIKLPTTYVVHFY